MFTVAIVGRPNVGKSTLFNRLAGRRLALVDDRPGVTRDRREGEGRLGDLSFAIIDTAGYETAKGEALEARMREQTDAAIAAADLCLFLIDARAGVTALDEMLAEALRRSGKPVAIVANKCEGNAGEDGVLDAYSLGLGEPIPLSAEHGEGLADLYGLLRRAMESGETVEDAAAKAPEKPWRIAVVGRPNVGKSTLVNRMLGEERLVTGPETGITRDSISVDWEWEGRPVKLFDTAGLRRRMRITDSLEKLSVGDTLRAIRFAEVVVLLMDAEAPLEKQDLQIAELVHEEGRALVLGLNKWDLVQGKPERDLDAEAERLLPQMRGVPLVRLSALTGRGIDKMMEAVARVRRDWGAQVKTPDLNRWLAEMEARHPPPAVHGRRIRLRYMAQLKTRPPTFALYASRAKHLPESYKRYLINGLREAFDLPAVPIRLYVRQPKNPYTDE